MSDDRFSYVHASVNASLQWLDNQEDSEGWELPDDDIDIAPHLMPTYQDEEDDTVLPSTTHPSYPFGNPYTSKLHFSTTLSAASGLPSTLSGSGSNLPPPSLFHKPTSSNPGSLATTLSNLQLRQLFSQTNFGEPRERRWMEIAPDQVVRGAPAVGILRREGTEDDGGSFIGSSASGGARSGAAHGGDPIEGARGPDAAVPAGQNAGDAPSDHDEDSPTA
ncbi:hypothetical protein OIV83_004005 [Microbotryomycetes sp. JL201]|nr:hypothetical protein OIV83_004005 [Microbotryomycetes sp. JL201]